MASNNQATAILTHWTFILSAIVAAVVFFLSANLESRFDHLGILDRNDVLFGADPKDRLQSLRKGWGFRELAHPNLSNFTNPPIRFGAKALKTLGLSERSEAELQRKLALLVAPAAHAALCVLWFVFFRYIGFRPWESLAIALLGAVCFSSFLFAAFPSHQILTAVGLSAGLLLAARDIRHGGGISRSAWVCLSVVLIGITITNLVSVVLLLLAAQCVGGLRFKAILRETAIVIGVAIVVSALAYVVIGAIYGDLGPRAASSWTKDWWRSSAAEVFNYAMQFPSALAHTYWPPPPRVCEAKAVTATYANLVTLDGVEVVWLRPRWESLCVLGMIAFGSIRLLRSNLVHRRLAVASLGILAFNWAFHSIWGGQLIVYSPHWQPASLLLLAGVISGQGAWWGPRMALFGALVIGVALNTARTMAGLVAALKGFQNCPLLTGG